MNYISEKSLLQALNSKKMEFGDSKHLGLPELRLVNERKKEFKDIQKRLGLTPYSLKILMSLQQYGKSKKIFKTSQMQMAYLLGCDRQTIRRATNYFNEVGLVFKYRSQDKWAVCSFELSKVAQDLIGFFKGSIANFYDIINEVWRHSVKKLLIKNVAPLKDSSSLFNSSIVYQQRLTMGCHGYMGEDTSEDYHIPFDNPPRVDFNNKLFSQEQETYADASVVKGAAPYNGGVTHKAKQPQRISTFIGSVFKKKEAQSTDQADTVTNKLARLGYKDMFNGMCTKYNDTRRYPVVYLISTVLPQDKEQQEARAAQLRLEELALCKHPAYLKVRAAGWIYIGDNLVQYGAAGVKRNLELIMNEYL